MLRVGMTITFFSVRPFTCSAAIIMFLLFGRINIFSAFTVSAALAGVAGALYSHNLATLQASKFNFNTSILALVFVVLGGLGNMRGSIIAAVLLTALPELLRGLNDYRMLIYAVVLIVMTIFNSSPRAIEMRSVWMEKLRRRGQGKKEAA